MNTVFLLMAEFDGETQLKLEDISEKYLGLNKASAHRLANKSQLPFLAYRCGTQRSQWLVSVTDFAEYIDKQRKESRDLWERMRD